MITLDRPSDGRLSAALALALASAAIAQPPPAVTQSDPVRPERYAPPAADVGGPAGTSPAAVVTFGPFTSIQVNVDANGDNILGDAANEPSIAVDPTAPDRMAIGWRQFDTTESSFRQAGHSSSRSGGRTWDGMGIIEPGIFRSDPVLEAGPDGTFYYLSLEVTPINEFFCWMFISADGGVTWPSKNFALGGDKAWFAIDTTDPDFDGKMFQAWNIAGNMFAPAQFNRSFDGGVSWSTAFEYDGVNFPSFGILDVGPDGEVYVVGAQNAAVTGTFWVVKSSTIGILNSLPNFEQIVQVDLGGNLVIGTGPNPSGLTGQLNVAVNRTEGPSRGHVYVLGSIDPPGPDPMDVHFIRSEDGGATWSAPVRVNDDVGNTWQWFGTMSVAPTGRLDVVWNSTADGGATNISALRYASSDDGGQSWSASQQASPTFDSFLGWPQQNKLGDYYDMISDRLGADLAWAATFNEEQDVYYLRIGPYDCNGNGVDDAVDIAGATAFDCNGNGIPDGCEIAAGAVSDDDGDGVPDECGCVGDCADGDGAVTIVDLLALLAQWGTAGPCNITGSGSVGTTDLLELLASWGPCP